MLNQRSTVSPLGARRNWKVEQPEPHSQFREEYPRIMGGNTVLPHYVSLWVLRKCSSAARTKTG